MTAQEEVSDSHVIVSDSHVVFISLIMEHASEWRIEDSVGGPFVIWCTFWGNVT